MKKDCIDTILPLFQAILLMMVFVYFPYKYVYSSTNMVITAPELITGTDAIDTGNLSIQIENIQDLNGPFIADGFAFANILGYPIGKSYLGSFPHFEFGFSIGVGGANMKYFDEDDPASDNGSFPSFGINPSLHFGVGLGYGLDVIGRLVYISKNSFDSIYDEDVDFDIVTLSDFMIYSIGGKLRYNIIKESVIAPYMLSFGGITLSIGCDALYGNIGVGVDYDYEFADVGIDFSSSANPLLAALNQSFNIQFIGDLDAAINWSIFSITTQAIAYFDFLYFFSLYSGFGLSCNIGTFGIEFEGDGEIFIVSDILANITGSETNRIGSLLFQTENSYKSTILLPSYIIGLEFNMLYLKLNLETMVNMRNASDVNGQLGARIQI